MYCFMQHYLRPYYEKKKRSISRYMWIWKGESVFLLETKLSPNFSVKAVKDISKICGKSEADVYVYKDKLN